MPENIELYLHLNDEQTGPHGLDQVAALLKNGDINHDTPAWHEGLSEWTYLGQLVDVETIRGAEASTTVHNSSLFNNPAVVTSLLGILFIVPLSLAYSHKAITSALAFAAYPIVPLLINCAVSMLAQGPATRATLVVPTLLYVFLQSSIIMNAGGSWLPKDVVVYVFGVCSIAIMILFWIAALIVEASWRRKKAGGGS